jgi:hypothetical protein
VCGRNFDNTLIKKKFGWAPTMPLKVWWAYIHPFELHTIS